MLINYTGWMKRDLTSICDFRKIRHHNTVSLFLFSFVCGFPKNLSKSLLLPIWMRHTRQLWLSHTYITFILGIVIIVLAKCEFSEKHGKLNCIIIMSHIIDFLANWKRTPMTNGVSWLQIFNRKSKFGVNRMLYIAEPLKTILARTDADVQLKNMDQHSWKTGIKR